MSGYELRFSMLQLAHNVLKERSAQDKKNFSDSDIVDLAKKFNEFISSDKNKYSDRDN